MHLARHASDRAHRIPMRHKPTRWIRAALHAPTGVVLASAAGAGLAGIVLVDQLNGDPRGLCLVGDVLADVAMRPQAALLLALGTQALAIGHLTDIADSERARFALNGILHHGARDLLRTSAGALLLLRKNARLAGLQSLPAARAFVLAILAGPQLRKALGGVLARGTETPGGEAG